MPEPATPHHWRSGAETSAATNSRERDCEASGRKTRDNSARPTQNVKHIPSAQAEQVRTASVGQQAAETRCRDQRKTASRYLANGAFRRDTTQSVDSGHIVDTSADDVVLSRRLQHPSQSREENSRNLPLVYGDLGPLGASFATGGEVPPNIDSKTECQTARGQLQFEYAGKNERETRMCKRRVSRRRLTQSPPFFT